MFVIQPFAISIFVNKPNYGITIKKRMAQRFECSTNGLIFQSVTPFIIVQICMSGWASLHPLIRPIHAWGSVLS